MIPTIFIFLGIFSILVFIHELGHFLAAKKVGIKVEEFGVGYPPRLWAKKIGETEYSINWIPFGGFVRLYGDEGEPLGEERKRGSQLINGAFWAKSKKARLAVILAGVISNFLLGVLIFSVVYSLSGIPQKMGKVTIIEVRVNSPAEKVGLKPNDSVLRVDEEPINSLEKFIKVINEKKGKEIKLLIEREENNPCGEKVLGGGGGFSCQDGNLVFWVVPRENPPQDEGPLGIVISDVRIVKYPFWQMIFLGVREGMKEAIRWGWLVLVSLRKMMVDLITARVIPQDVAGPVGIFQATAAVVPGGILSIFQFLGILSVNLAVLNMLPLPALDGGRLVFIAYEALARRRPKPSVERTVNTIGMIFLILLLVLITINDVRRLIESPFPFRGK